MGSVATSWLQGPGLEHGLLSAAEFNIFSLCSCDFPLGLTRFSPAVQKHAGSSDYAGLPQV